MRKTILALLVCLLAVPAVGSAAMMRRAGDGTLSVAGSTGRDKVTVEARGGVIGRFDNGLVTITDLTPEDQFDPVVFGDEYPTRQLENGGVVYRGTNVRFRLVGGRFRIFLNGSGIDLSAVGNGTVTLEAAAKGTPGTYSLEGDDCRSPKVKCKLLPEVAKRFRLGLDPGPSLPR
ncbi:MAG TPA: hypothetical protein VEY87_07590 [Gaiellaceae bacterium]|jgi:hypothetical protein|nr:hypothetical protein [Gaiellaceae bacterium]